jgi:hypothetical protein
VATPVLGLRLKVFCLVVRWSGTDLPWSPTSAANDIAPEHITGQIVYRAEDGVAVTLVARR